MDKVSFKKMNIKDMIKDKLSFTLVDSVLKLHKGHYKGQTVL
jgi:hypothetical protein